MKCVQIVIVVMEGPFPEVGKKKRQKSTFGEKKNKRQRVKKVCVCVSVCVSMCLCSDVCNRKQEQE